MAGLELAFCAVIQASRLTECFALTQTKNVRSDLSDHVSERTHRQPCRASDTCRVDVDQRAVPGVVISRRAPEN